MRYSTYSTYSKGAGTVRVRLHLPGIEASCRARAARGRSRGENFGRLSKFSGGCRNFRQFTENFGRRAQVPQLTGGAGQIKLSHVAATLLPKKNPGAGLARAWCGPGAP